MNLTEAIEKSEIELKQKQIEHQALINYQKNLKDKEATKLLLESQKLIELESVLNDEINTYNKIKFDLEEFVNKGIPGTLSRSKKKEYNIKKLNFETKIKKQEGCIEVAKFNLIQLKIKIKKREDIKAAAEHQAVLKRRQRIKKIKKQKESLPARREHYNKLMQDVINASKKSKFNPSQYINHALSNLDVFCVLNSEPEFSTQEACKKIFKLD